MHTYYALFEQDPMSCCDYTIGCGKSFLKLQATTMQEAEVEVEKYVRENFRWGGESEIEKIRIFETTSVLEIDPEDIYYRQRQEGIKRKEEEVQRKELEELDRLKAKYENKQ